MKRKSVRPSARGGAPGPKCRACAKPMTPLYARRPGGAGHERIPDVFWCEACGVVGEGRTGTRFFRP